jgi:hypothetical protein
MLGSWAMCQAPRKADGSEPNEHHGSEQLADRAGAATLDREQRYQNGASDRHDRRLGCGLRHANPLDRAENRDRRSDRPVSLEKRGSDDHQDSDPGDTSVLRAQSLRPDAEEGEDFRLRPCCLPA